MSRRVFAVLRAAAQPATERMAAAVGESRRPGKRLASPSGLFGDRREPSNRWFTGEASGGGSGPGRQPSGNPSADGAVRTSSPVSPSDRTSPPFRDGGASTGRSASFRRSRRWTGLAQRGVLVCQGEAAVATVRRSRPIGSQATMSHRRRHHVGQPSPDWYPLDTVGPTVSVWRATTMSLAACLRHMGRPGSPRRDERWSPRRIARDQARSRPGHPTRGSSDSRVDYRSTPPADVGAAAGGEPGCGATPELGGDAFGLLCEDLGVGQPGVVVQSGMRLGIAQLAARPGAVVRDQRAGNSRRPQLDRTQDQWGRHQRLVWPGLFGRFRIKCPSAP
jgi:hypothetical protein